MPKVFSPSWVGSNCHVLVIFLFNLINRCLCIYETSFNYVLSLLQNHGFNTNFLSLILSYFQSWHPLNQNGFNPNKLLFVDTKLIKFVLIKMTMSKMVGMIKLLIDMVKQIYSKKNLSNFFYLFIFCYNKQVAKLVKDC